MTLILTLVSSNKVVQVSDRRLTLGRNVHDINANKAICVGCNDAHFSVGYTGVAEIDGQRTDYWLVDQISSIFQSGNEDVLTVYKALQERATKAISRLRYKGRPVHPQGRGLTLVLAGYRTIEATTVPFLAYISNLNLDNSNPLHVENTFSRKGWMFDPRARADKQMIFVHGARVTFNAGDPAGAKICRRYWEMTRILKRIDLGHEPESRTTADRMAWLIRETSSHPRHGYLVGRDCLSVVIHSNSPAMPTHYHPDKATTVEYGPHLVTPMLSTWDVEFDLDPQIPDLAAPIELPLRTSHRGTKGIVRERSAVAPDPLRDSVARYFAAYYQEARSQLAGKSFGVATVPSHLMPWHKLVRTWETQDGYFVVEHISNPKDSSYQGHASVRSDRWEDYLHLYPRRDQTLREMTGLELEDGRAIPTTEIRGKLIADPGYDEVQVGDYLERVDMLPKDKVSEFTEEKAREAARHDMQPYVE